MRLTIPSGSCAQMMAGLVWASGRGIGLPASPGPHHLDPVFGVSVGKVGSSVGDRPSETSAPCSALLTSGHRPCASYKAPTACLTAVYTLTDLGTEAGPAGVGLSLRVRCTHLYQSSLQDKLSYENSVIVFNVLIYEVVYLYDLRDLGTKDTF